MTLKSVDASRSHWPIAFTFFYCTKHKVAIHESKSDKISMQNACSESFWNMKVGISWWLSSILFVFFFLTFYIQTLFWRKEHISAFGPWLFLKWSCMEQVMIKVVAASIWWTIRTRLNYYCPPTKLREGNVFTGVCLSFHKGVSTVWQLPMMYWTSLYVSPWPLSDIRPGNPC